MLDAPLLRIENLRVDFQTHDGKVSGVQDVSFSIAPGECVCVVGESGSGKSVSSLSVMRLVEYGGGEIAGGHIFFARKSGETEDLTQAGPVEMRQIRGSEIGMIFQEPMTALNPVFTIGDQIVETIIEHRGGPRAEARAEAIRLLERVRLPDAAQLMRRYPHQLSGGMRQRVMIAAALTLDPALLLADEPTTALDVTVQAQVLELLVDIRNRTGKGVLLITHDIGAVAEIADRVIVMKGGSVVEAGPWDQVLNAPRDPYTAALIGAHAALEQALVPEASHG